MYLINGKFIEHSTVNQFLKWVSNVVLSFLNNLYPPLYSENRSVCYTFRIQNDVYQLGSQ